MLCSATLLFFDAEGGREEGGGGEDLGDGRAPGVLRDASFGDLCAGGAPGGDATCNGEA